MRNVTTLSLASLLIIAFAQSSLAVTFDYATANLWPQQFPQFCAGNKQSPIDLKKPCKKELPRPEPRTITLGNRFAAVANGKSIDVSITSSNSEFDLKLDPSSSTVWILDSYHFHWGVDSSQGSEHLINGASFPLELHLVHYNSKYSSVSEAVNSPDGLAVIGVFFQETASVPSDSFATAMLPNDLSNLQSVGGNTTFPAWLIAEYLYREADLTSFYRYSGSLTTPVCNEVVTWTVLKKPLLISTQQLQRIRRVALNNNEKYNFRPVQPLNHRKLYYSASNSVKFSASVMFIAALLSLNRWSMLSA